MSIAVTTYAEFALQDKIKVSLIEMPKMVDINDINVKISLKRLTISEIERLRNRTIETKVIRATNSYNFLVNCVLIVKHFIIWTKQVESTAHDKSTAHLTGAKSQGINVNMHGHCPTQTNVKRKLKVAESKHSKRRKISENNEHCSILNQNLAQIINSVKLKKKR